MKLTATATPKEVGAYMIDLVSRVGKQATVAANVEMNGLVSFGLWPSGIIRSSGYIRCEGATWAEAAESLDTKWEAQSANHRSVSLRKMAMEIIRITSDQGECTDRSLRLTFDQSEIDELGSEASELANDMAGNGPFSIKQTASANAA